MEADAMNNLSHSLAVLGVNMSQIEDVDDNSSDGQQQQQQVEGGADSQQQQQQPANDDTYNKLEATIKAYGVEDYDISEHKGKQLTAEQARQVVRDAIRHQELSKIDPVAAAAVKSGIDIQQYRNELANVDQELSLDNASLVKHKLFIQIWNDEAKLGTLPKDQKAAEQHVAALTEERAKRYNIDEAAANIRKSLNDHKAALPQQLKQAYDKQVQEDIKRYNANIPAMLASKEAKTVMDNGGVVPYADDNDRKGFEKYVKDMLTVPDGKTTNKLQEVLSSKENIYKMLRLLHASESGVLSKTRKTSQAAAFDALDEFTSSSGGVGSDNGSSKIVKKTSYEQVDL